jgi:hypothetical protein
MYPSRPLNILDCNGNIVEQYSFHALSYEGDRGIDPDPFPSHLQLTISPLPLD